MSALSAFFIKAASFLSILAVVVTAMLSSPPQNPPIEQKAEGTVRILTFNIRCTNVGTHSWDDRINAVTGAIEAVAPDSFGVQEATP